MTTYSGSSSISPILTTAALNGLKIIAASLFLALASQASFIIPYTPILVTLQTAAIFLMGFKLGPVKAALAVILYLAEGVVGLPVFALGQSGFAILAGPKGGFYLGFILTAFISGYARKEHPIPRLFITFMLANAATYAIGLPWLAMWVGEKQVLLLGLYPFLLGDILKVAATTSLIKGLNKI